MSDPSDEFGRRVADALRAKADDAPAGRPLASIARRRIRRRRQSLLAGAAAVLVAVAIGGVWQGVSGTVRENASTADSPAGSGQATEQDHVPDKPAQTAHQSTGCPASHPITVTPLRSTAITAGLDLNTPVTGLTACRYRVVKPGERHATLLIGSAAFDARQAQAVVDAIKPLPERNPDLPVFKCKPEAVEPSEAIVLRFATAAGIREIWVVYDGCADAGFFTGTKVYGLYAEPLRLFMTGAVRPSRGTYLDALPGW
jgi:hypothetical protein